MDAISLALAFLVLQSASPTSLTAAQELASPEISTERATNPAMTIVRTPRADSVANERRALEEMRPVLRGFRASLLTSGPPSDDALHNIVCCPLEQHVEELAPELRATLSQASTFVARHLASDGLLRTLVHAIELIGPQRFEAASAAEWLADCGLPVDWLAAFDREHDARALIRRVAAVLTKEGRSQQLLDELAQLPLRFKPSCPGLRILTESGEHEIGVLRLQLTSASYWQGAGDGGCIDLARQLSQLLPEAEFIASIEEKHLAGFLDTAASWPIPASQRWTVVPAQLPLAQWAQDNGKPGLVEAADGSAAKVVTLVPRYASRGEDGTPFIPGETFVIEDFAALGRAVVQSPLLFQGGNSIAVRNPRTLERVLLLGEAEVYRNIALGLSGEQVLEAFKLEFGVDRVVVLPALSFHIDYEVSVRAIGDELVAFVNDTPAAVQLVLLCGVNALAAHGRLDEHAALELRQQLDSGRWAEFADGISTRIFSDVSEYGHFPESLALLFSTGPADSGVGNFQTFLLALDMLYSHSVELAELPFDAHTSSYLSSFLRRDAQREAFNAQLRAEGFRVVPIPSLAESTRGINYLNGVHDRTRYLMPVHGGLFAPLDQRAVQAFELALGPAVKVFPVLTSESQRRGGGVHCSVSAYPRP